LKSLSPEVSSPAADLGPDWASVEPLERGNLWLLALHQIVFRVGWIFKTESIIIPAFLDTISGAGWLRGFLPVLTRLGQGLPPVFGTRLLRRTARKKAALAWLTVLMALPFALLAVLWWRVGAAPPRCMPAAFLVLYLVFFIAYGFYQLAFGAAQGKLIRPTRRGWLMLVSTFGGLVPAMLAAWWLLDDWLRRPVPGFAWIFGFVAAAFFCSLLGVLALREPADEHPTPLAPGSSLADVARTLAGDRALRRLVLVAMLFAGGLIVAPHYEALARQQFGLEGSHLMLWVLTQNASVSLLSLIVGPLADARGYRITLRLLVFGSALAPLYAVALTHLPAAVAARAFWLVFIPLGFSPLLVATLMNYTLEICRPAEHPLYLSAVNLCLMVPFLLSPLVGWLVDTIGFRTVFLATAGLILASGLLTFALDEPRGPPHAIDSQGPEGQG
jgi:hypothetical protein